jgi:hypothetical protein
MIQERSKQGLGTRLQLYDMSALLVVVVSLLVVMLPLSLLSCCLLSRI